TAGLTLACQPSYLFGHPKRPYAISRNRCTVSTVLAVRLPPKRLSVFARFTQLRFQRRIFGETSCDNGREKMADSGTVRLVMTDGISVEEALRRSAAAARREHVRAGLSMPVWRSGRMVWIEPTELQ